MKTGFLIDGVDVGNVPDNIPNTPSADEGSRNSGSKELKLSTSIDVAKFLLLALLLVNFFRALRGDAEYFSFARFFEVLQNVPAIPLDWISTFSWQLDPSVLGDWSEAFNWLRDAIISVANLFSSSLSTFLYVGTGIGNLVIFAGYFVGQLFY